MERSFGEVVVKFILDALLVIAIIVAIAFLAAVYSGVIQ